MTFPRPTVVAAPGVATPGPGANLTRPASGIFLLLVVYLFILFSRIEESFIYSTGLFLHLSLILSWGGAVAALATGKFLRAAGSRIAGLLFVFTGWLLLAILFST